MYVKNAKQDNYLMPQDMLVQGELTNAEETKYKVFKLHALLV